MISAEKSSLFAIFFRFFTKEAGSSCKNTAGDSIFVQRAALIECLTKNFLRDYPYPAFGENALPLGTLAPIMRLLGRCATVPPFVNRHRALRGGIFFCSFPFSCVLSLAFFRQIWYNKVLYSYDCEIFIKVTLPNQKGWFSLWRRKRFSRTPPQSFLPC